MFGHEHDDFRFQTPMYRYPCIFNCFCFCWQLDLIKLMPFLFGWLHMELVCKCSQMIGFGGSQRTVIEIYISSSAFTNVCHYLSLQWLINCSKLIPSKKSLHLSHYFCLNFDTGGTLACTYISIFFLILSCLTLYHYQG